MTSTYANREIDLNRRSTPVALALGTTTTISYGTLYYAFGVLADEMAADTGLSVTTVFGLFSISMLAAAIMAPFTGRALDRFAPAMIMVAGSLGSSAFLALMSLVPGPIAFAVFLFLAQISSTAVLYEAAFTVATAYVPDYSRRTITIITLIAGFASTIFWPLTLWLINTMDWRGIFLIYAGLHMVICLPIHFWLARGKRADGSGGVDTSEQSNPPKPGRITGGGPRREAFFLMLIIFAAIGFTIASVHLHLIAILDAIGLAAHAALIGALIGPAQVAGRLAEFLSGGRLPALRLMVFTCATLAGGLVLLIVGPSTLIMASLAMMIYGVGQGLSSILRGVLPLEVLGTREFGSLLGKISSAALVMMAVAPVATAAVRETYGAQFAVGTIASIAFIGMLASMRLTVIVRNWERDAAPNPAA